MFEEYHKATQELGKTAQRVSASVGESMRLLGQTLAEVFKPLFDALENIDFEAYITDATNALDKFKIILLELGYPPFDDIDIEQIKRINAYYDANGKHKTSKLVRRILVHIYNEAEIKKMVAYWTKHKKTGSRIHILNEAVQCHLDGRYYAAISTFMPQLEGMIAERFNHKAHLDQKQLKKYLQDLLNKESSFSFDKSIQLFYLKIILDHFEHGKPIKSPLSRHAILHGADTKFGYKANSLRCIILIDYLIHKL